MKKEYIIELIELIEKIPKKDLKRLRNDLVHSKKSGVASFTRKTVRVDREKRELIGNLPFILFSKEYLPNNQDIREFAKNNLQIDIHRGKNRSRAEMIGIIIEEVSKLDSLQIIKFNSTLIEILDNSKKNKGMNFMTKWDKVIRNLR